jgi:Flp pilus assembly CpaF family ATPase
MKSKIEKLNTYLIRESVFNKDERIFTIDCSKCSESIENGDAYEQCVKCLLKSIFWGNNKDFKKSNLKIHGAIIETSKIILILRYFKKLKEINKIWRRIEKIGRTNCIFQEFNCRVESINNALLSFNDSIIFDPILVFNFIIDIKEEILAHKFFNIECQKCSIKILGLLDSILGIFNNLEIIIHYLKFLEKNDNSKDILKFYKKFFFNSQKIFNENGINNEIIRSPRVELLESYCSGENRIFQISIYNIKGEYEKKYLINYDFDSKGDEKYFKTIVNDAKNNLTLIESNEIIPLEELINFYKKKATDYLNLKYKLSEKEKQKVSYIAALHKLNLEKIFPLLVDDLIEEIFLDSPIEKIYINHQKYGRCRTEIGYNLNDIERIKTFLRLYSGKRLDYSNPSIKVVIKNKYFYCRFAVDVEPIQLNNFALDIRKLNKNILTIQDLLKNGTLSPSLASFLYILVLRRINITVTGETDTGKTTLINALDLLAPKEFRKIYVENVNESLNQSRFERHQLKYKVDSLEDLSNHLLSKQNQIKNLLHRTPDIIYLGEILTKNEAEAMFHCLAAGLRGFQTIHSNNINSLINRIIHHFKIDKTCLHDLGIIILMKKNREKRFIDSITEMHEKFDKDNEMYVNLFKRDPCLKNWSMLQDLYNSNTIKTLRKYEDMQKEKFDTLFNLYLDVFDTLQKLDKIIITKLIDLFDQISFQSFISVDALRLFWKNWKNTCGLNL